MNSRLPKLLEFLDRPIEGSREPISAPWLLSSFSSPIWKCRFGKIELEIDFAVKLNDGSLLTDAANRELETALKKFLCLQTHPLVVGTRPLGGFAQRDRVYTALHLVDYWLLNAGSLDLVKLGLGNFDANEVKIFTALLASGSQIQRSIYNPVSVVSEYLNGQLSLLTAAEVALLFDDERLKKTKSGHGYNGANVPLVPMLEAHSTTEMRLSLTLEEINLGRRLLYRDGLYVWNRAQQVCSLDIGELLKRAYGHRILNSRAKFDKFELPELSWAGVKPTHIEFPRAPVHTNAADPRVGGEYYKRYVSALSTLRHLAGQAMPWVASESLAAVNQLANLAPDQFKEKGRFKLLPFEVTQSLLNKSMDFMYRYGESIIDCLLEVQQMGDMEPVQCFEPLGELNVVGWSLQPQIGSEMYFETLRASPGLYDVFSILLGAIDVCVQSVMVRRTRELVLLGTDCIGSNETGDYVLRHHAGKRNLSDIHEQSQKPMPPLAAHALGLLGRIHRRARELHLDLGEQLFVRPSTRHPGRGGGLNAEAFVKVMGPDLLECIDLLCDYFEVARDDEGRRYYVRNHQLRRSFAFQFIWCGFFGGVDVLGWFLGHGSNRSTSRYFTELLSGDAIVLKASVASKLMRAKQPMADGLAEFIAAKHGVAVDILFVLHEDSVTEWVEQAIIEGSVDIKVEFFDGTGGENYRSLLIVEEKQ